MRRYYRGHDLQRIHSVAEMAAAARARLPHFAWEYLAGGAEDELTLSRNVSDLQAIGLQAHTLRPCAEPKREVTLLGKARPLPIGIGPSGYNGMLWPDADLALARAAARRRLPFTLSTVSNATIEAVRQAAPELDFWFQLYPMKAAEMQEDLLLRAERAGCEVLVVTTDASILGNREWDRRSFARPRQLSLRNKLDVLLHPGWMKRVLYPGGMPVLGNLAPYIPPAERNALGSMKFVSEQMDTQFSWDKLARLRQRWQGKLVLKGILHEEDALQAVALGMDGIVVTNHGGRQLDGSLSAIRALQRIAPAVAGRTTVLFDSGIRRGTDIVKALALGADAVLSARATLYGVATAGEAGAGRVLDLLAEELKRNLQLMGCDDINALDSRWLC
ncbi:2-hydroxy-acid oxidase [Pokkaliibacter plantistimulans]|uniref:2-hydroxy-acid oxidase n=2 Tax=Pseudomonadota TaxID=1224 RepID=A0ABX5LZJ0_9GAMM|nr:alpha-hydroxy acid oxidase [Pokkaliibacter plantistimulans]PXF31574.1 2-hydroxy-acid oxidase [Pokkaliibacter plantistimulans]